MNNNIYEEEYEIIKKYLEITKNHSLLKSKERYLVSSNLFIDTKKMMLYYPFSHWLSSSGIEYRLWFNKLIKDGWEKLDTPYTFPIGNYQGEKTILCLNYSNKPNYMIFYILYRLTINDDPLSDDWRSYSVSEKWKQSLFYMIPNPILDFLEKNDNYIYLNPRDFEIMISFLFPEESDFSQNTLVISNTQKIHIEKLKPYILKETNQTELKKHQLFIEYIDDLITKIDTFTNSDKNHIKNYNQLYYQLSTLKSENSTLQDIQSYLLTKFDFSFDRLKEELINFKLESIEYLETIDNQDSIFKLHELSQQKVDFTFLYEVIAQRYNNHVEQIHSFQENQNFLTKLYQRVEKLFKEDNHFLHGKKSQLLGILKEDCIAEEIDNIFEEWQSEIDKINLTYLSLIKAYFHQQISQTLLLDALDILFVIKDRLEKFFETTRSGIYIKYQNNAKNDLLQKVDTQSRIFDIYKTIQPQFIEIIKKEQNLSYQKYLSKNINQLIDFHFYEDNNFEMISDEFMKLAKQNLEIYLNDIEQYGKELEKRDMEIGKLFFKMKKSLEKENK